MRLSTRFAVCLAVLVPLLVLLGGMLVLSLVSHDLSTERDRGLALRTRALAPMATSYMWRVRLVPEVHPDLIARRLATAALSAGNPGGVRVDVSGAAPLVIGDVPATMPATGRDGPATFSGGGRSWRFTTSGLGVLKGSGRLWVFEAEEHLDRDLAVLRERVVLVTLVAAAAGAMAGFRLGRLAVRPLTVLRRQARELDVPAVSDTRLATASGVVEVDELARLLNELLDRRDAAVTRTAEALETARAFAATVSHELRTPLTSMGTNLGLLDHPGLDPAERAEVIADLRAEHDRTQRLVTMLRRLARGELVEPAAFTGTDLAEITATAVEEARRRHPDAAITLSGTGDLPVRGWDEGLRVVVDNLLDNAAIHGVVHDADGTGHAVVTVTLRTAGGEAVLGVQDTGPGIPPAERESVFTRFHRRAGSPGAGLGLTLVRQQVLLHGGTVTVTGPEPGPPDGAEPGDAGPGTGTRVEVRLPVEDARSAGTLPAPARDLP
ncbi:HAMP domain-containing sensor histidine kinase [Streptosporangium longisporum]|uniref:histidine kinase n=1 Tax=Streptosporangium longisporum TaxID=46187 RepID=A0ABP6KSZ2_9ACTN